MTLKFSGTASTWTPTRDPARTGFRTERQWMNPSIRSGGGNVFVFDRNVVRDVLEFTWAPIDPDDLENLVTFIDDMDGGGLSFTMIDPAGHYHSRCHIIEPNDFHWTPEDLMDDELTIQVLVLGGHIMDEERNRLTDESGNLLLTD